MRTAIETRLVTLIGEYCLVDTSTLARDTLTDDLGLDSLSLTQIITAMEKEFSFALSDEDLVSLLVARSIGHFSDILNEALNSSNRVTPESSYEQG